MEVSFYKSPQFSLIFYIGFHYIWPILGNITESPTEDTEELISQPNTALLTLVLCIGTFLIALKVKKLKTGHYFGKMVINILWYYYVSDPLSDPNLQTKPHAELLKCEHSVTLGTTLYNCWHEEWLCIGTNLCSMCIGPYKVKDRRDLKPFCSHHLLMQVITLLENGTKIRYSGLPGNKVPNYVLIRCNI